MDLPAPGPLSGFSRGFARLRGWQHTISLYEISKSRDFNCDFVFQQ